MMIVLIAVTLLVVVLAIRWLGDRQGGAHPGHQQGKTPLDILKERFAHGEIDRQEFEERRRVLGE